MSIQRTQGFILEREELRETSLFVTAFTRDFGKVHGILKGARGSRARSAVKCLFFGLDQIVFYEKRKSDLFIISQCEQQEIFFNILKDWKRLSTAYYMLELVDVFTEPCGGSREIFENLLNSLIFLDRKKEPDAIARLFEVKFLAALGLWPGSEGFKLSNGARSTLSCFEKMHAMFLQR